MKSYVFIKEPGQLLGVVSQRCVPSGKTRLRGNITEAEFIPIEKGHWRERFWATREMIVDNPVLTIDEVL